MPRTHHQHTVNQHTVNQDHSTTNSNLRSRPRTTAIASLMLGIVVGIGSSLSGAAWANAGDRLAQANPDASSTETASDSNEAAGTSTANATRFSCEFQDGEYTVMYTPESQPDNMYAWAAPDDMGGGWSADRRCAEISRRLETYRPDGLLELRTSTENNYNTVCATTEQNPTCRIVFTVPNGQDPLMTRDRVFENLAAANSGQNTEAINTYRSGGVYRGGGNPSSGGNYAILERIGAEFGIELPSLPGSRPVRSSRASSINLRPFLAPADGGTGEYLRSGAPSLLNPEDFR